MKETINLELDKYESRIVVNALNILRNQEKLEGNDTIVIEEMLFKVIDAISKKKGLVRSLKFVDSTKY